AEVLNWPSNGVSLRLCDLTDGDSWHGVDTDDVQRIGLSVGDSIIDRNDLRDDSVLKVHSLLRGVVHAPSGTDYGVLKSFGRVSEADTWRPVRLRHWVDGRAALS